MLSGTNGTVPIFSLKFETDPLVIAVSAIGFIIIVIAQKLFMKSHTGSDGKMDMGMDDM